MNPTSVIPKKGRLDGNTWRSSHLVLAVGVLLWVVAGCSPPPAAEGPDNTNDSATANTNDNAANDNDNADAAELLDLQACLDELGPLLSADGGPWTLTLDGPATAGHLATLELSGNGTILREARVDIVDFSGNPGFFEEVVLNFEIALDESQLTVTASGLSGTGSTTRIFVTGDPNGGRCEAVDGGVQLSDTSLDYTITTGETRLEAVSSGSLLQATNGS